MKRKAKWLGTPIHVISQLLISITSYIFKPFTRREKNAVREYWSSIYSGDYRDNYIYDGKTKHYYDDITKIIPLISCANQRTIIDLCCGNGSFYYWCQENQIPIKNYYGIDFSITNTVLSENACLKNGNILDYVAEKDDIIIVSNGCCYLDDMDFCLLTSNISKCSDIIVIEPIPSVFWDAQFAHIHLYYRSSQKIINHFNSLGFHCKYVSTDYMIKIVNMFIFPLKATYYFQKSS